MPFHLRPHIIIRRRIITRHHRQAIQRSRATHQLGTRTLTDKGRYERRRAIMIRASAGEGPMRLSVRFEAIVRVDP
jgi:hypothetical protein